MQQTCATCKRMPIDRQSKRDVIVSSLKSTDTQYQYAAVRLTRKVQCHRQKPQHSMADDHERNVGIPSSATASSESWTELRACSKSSGTYPKHCSLLVQAMHETKAAATTWHSCGRNAPTAFGIEARIWRSACNELEMSRLRQLLSSPCRCH